MAAIAVDALGAENVVGVGMPSQYSSLGSIDDARRLAQRSRGEVRVGVDRRSVRGVQKALEPLFEGTAFGLADGEPAAAHHGTLLMALSNKLGALVLTTGNKCEMAVGYCTLYGDMVGALAVMAT